MNRRHSDQNHPWSQENPRDQIQVLLGALEGDLHNMNRGLLNDKQVPRMWKILQDAQLLAAGLPTGEWDKEDKGGDHDP